MSRVPGLPGLREPEVDSLVVDVQGHRYGHYQYEKVLHSTDSGIKQVKLGRLTVRSNWLSLRPLLV